MEQHVTYAGIIFSKHHIGQRRSIQLDGEEQFGLILHIDQSTEIIDTNGESIIFEQLAIGMAVKVVHRETVRMSIPPQTYAFKIQILA